MRKQVVSSKQKGVSSNQVTLTNQLDRKRSLNHQSDLLVTDNFNGLVQDFSAIPIDLRSTQCSIQPKLKIGDPNDRFEKEADRVADQVMRIPATKAIDNPLLGSPRHLKNSQNIQRKCSICAVCSEQEEFIQAKSKLPKEPAVSPSTRLMIRSLQGAGQPMSQVDRNFFEPRFGTDFSHVRVHTNGQANQAAINLGARAFTVGSNVVFGAGEYSSQSNSGKWLFAHELAHVVQQVGAKPISTEQDQAFLSEQTKQPSTANYPDIRFRRSEKVIQRDLLDAVQALHSRNPRLMNWVFELGTAYEYLRSQTPSLSELGRRRVAAVENAFRRAEQQGFSEASLVRWMQTIFASLGSLTARGPWMSDEQHERILDASRAVQSASRLSIPSLSAVADQIAQERSQRRHRSEVTMLSGRLRRYIRRHWTRIRTAPRFQWLRIERIMRRTLTTDEEFSEYLASLSETNQNLQQFLSLLQRNPDAIQRNQNDIFRAMVLAVGGEWADVGEQSEDQVLAGELTGDTETSLEAEVVGTVVDTAITTLPILDQIGDVRDFSAHLYALLNVSGRHAEEATSPMRWLSVVLSGIGAIPVIGSSMKGTGRIIVRILRRIGSGVSGVVSRAIAPVVRFVRRILPDAIPWFRRLLTRASDGWGSVVNSVTRKWDEVASAVSARLDNALLRATEFGTRMRGRWLWVRSTARERIGQALETMRQLFAPVYRGALAALQRGGRVAQRLIPTNLLTRANLMLERIASLIGASRIRISRLRQRISHTVNNLVDRFSTPTRRLQRLDVDMQRLDGLQTRLQRALDIGDSEAAELLYREAQDVTNSIERRLSRSAGAEVADETEVVAETGSRSTNRAAQEAEGSSQVPPMSHSEHTSPDPIPPASQAEASTQLPPSHNPSELEESIPVEALTTEQRRLARIRREQESLRELASARQSIRPVDDSRLIEEGYQVEIELEDGVFYRRRNDGVWCRFNSPGDCGESVPDSIENRAQEVLADLTDEEIDASLDGFEDLIAANDLSDFRPARGHPTAVAFDNITGETMAAMFGLDPSQMTSARRLLSGQEFDDDMQSVFQAAARSSDLVVARSNLSARVLSDLEETILNDDALNVASELRRSATSILGDSAGHHHGRVFSPLTRDAETLRRRMQRLAFEIELDPQSFSGPILQGRVRRLVGSYRRNLFGTMRNRFYRLIAGDARLTQQLSQSEASAALRIRQLFENSGLEIPTDGAAPYWQIDRDLFTAYLQELEIIDDTVDTSHPMWRWLTNNHFRIPLSIEHIDRLSDNPIMGLNPINFMLTILRENSVVLERIRRRARSAGH